MDDGRTLEKEVEFPRGHAGNPMTDAEVEAKFRALVEPRYGRERVEKILAGWELDTFKTAGALTKLLDVQANSSHHPGMAWASGSDSSCRRCQRS